MKSRWFHRPGAAGAGGPRRVAVAALAWTVLLTGGQARGATGDAGRSLFESRCASCHGLDGRGAPGEQALGVPLPDFSDCSFATREPDTDWAAVAHGGGPARGFSELMPAQGDALTREEIEAILGHLRSFCSDDRWPRGELNLPRPLVTEKAFPEDEVVASAFVNVNRGGAVASELLVEKRIGPRGQLEAVLPIVAREQLPSGAWRAGIGDVALAGKYAFFHRLEWGSIASLGGEVIFPTGDEEAGLGRGSVVFEPYLAVGQLLPWDGFFQLQALGEIPVDRDLDDEVQLRMTLGRSFTFVPYGRVISPMVEFIGGWEFGQDVTSQWDAVPQVQIPLNRRQNIRLDVGARIPMTEFDARAVQVGAYLLWDWYDGGLLEGW